MKIPGKESGPCLLSSVKRIDWKRSMIFYVVWGGGGSWSTFKGRLYLLLRLKKTCDGILELHF